MGNRRVASWVYLAEIPSKVVAIDRYVSFYIALYITRETMERSGGVSSLVRQGFFS